MNNLNSSNRINKLPIIFILNGLANKYQDIGGEVIGDCQASNIEKEINAIVPY